MAAPRPPPQDLEDYSAAATLIPFRRPVPLLRRPIKAGTPDNPSSGPYLLAFEDPQSWAAAYKACEARIIEQCESGARVGCSISASSKCKPPWWKEILGLAKQDFSERAKCEELEMEACFESAKAKCGEFAKQKCLPAFKNARIKVNGWNSKQVDWKEVSKLISGVCFVNNESFGVGCLGFDKSWGEFRCKFEVTNIKGSDLLGSNDTGIGDYLRNCSGKRTWKRRNLN
ncbi:uncharacterized protein LOC111411826 isoform X2 [Olea europaea var. sylvestris]|uniref:Uncharacterized protein n=1 Tax=Olea europaea subsp. europaea TaxID=158383 RepID=A0A8S0V000_OLEEU|nr:uncharacterized protein LOC111411826 isoform X2 [Olea europaea var. sylvestris]CAA3023724.1 Hypothetical predicted protein [Olea europaea subsp. europaea]